MNDSAAATPTTHNQPEYTVSEISGALKRVVEEKFSYVRVRGEISGYRGPHSSGHCYFGLKDDRAKMDAVIWKGSVSRLAFKPEEGMEVIATGKLTTFPGTSKYQIVIEQMEIAGQGALMALLEKRKQQLAAEGLFDPARKKPLPYLPLTIGVITSPTGAVIRDILHRLADRFPVRVLLWPVAVQGDGAAAQIANAITEFNKLTPEELATTSAVEARSLRGAKEPEALNANNRLSINRPDLLIIARGGGSIEDLWPFNEEIVVRAAAASQIPLISAVGHETDTTLIDYAADRRAPTPTAAAEMAVPVLADLRYAITDYQQRFDRAMQRQLEMHQQHLAGLARGLPRPQELLAQAEQKLDQVTERLDRALLQGITARMQKLEGLAARLPHPRQQITRLETQLDQWGERLAPALLRLITRLEEKTLQTARHLELLDYRKVLARGFALVRDAQGAVISTTAQAVAAAQVQLTLTDGTLAAHISDATPPITKPKKPAKTSSTPAQESLF